MCPVRSSCQLGETLPSVDDVLQSLLRVLLQGFPQFFDQTLLQNSFLPFHPTSSSTTWDWIFPFSREVAPALEIASSLQLLSTSSPSICFLHSDHRNGKLIVEKQNHRTQLTNFSFFMILPDSLILGPWTLWSFWIGRRWWCWLVALRCKDANRLENAFAQKILSSEMRY